MALIPQQVSGKKLGSYELAKEVFTSGVGASYIAKSSAGDCVLLTKVHRHVAKSPQLCDAFLAEAKAARALSHETIAPVVDHGIADGEPFVAFGYTECETLAGLLRKSGPEGLSLGVAARIVLDLFEAIEAAANGGGTLSHGELGPWCVHVGVDGRARVTGFGVDRALVRFGLHYAKNLERLTYAAPERVKAMSLTLGPAPPAPDLRSDTFSAAVLAWELLSRQRLFASRMEAAIIQKVLTGPIADLKTVRAEISQAVSDAIARGLKREPSERPSPEAIRHALEADAGIASTEEVGQLVESTRGKAPTTRSEPLRAGIGFNRSVTPKGFAAVRPEGANGRGQNGEHTETRRPLSVPPPAIGVLSPAGAAKKRAQTLIGFSPTTSAEPAGKPEAAGGADIEDEATNVDVKVAAPAIAIPAPAPSSTDATELIEEISTSDGELLVEEDTHVAAPKARPPVPNAPPARRPPPKPRQVTLMGIEPLAEAEPKPAPTPSPQPVAAAPTPAPAAAKRDERPKLDVSKLAVVGSHAGPIRPGAILTTGSGKQYQLLSSVARGGMAIVWAARPAGSHDLDQIVAVKTMLPEVSDDVDFEKMFLDEMRVAAQIKHPNVAEILELGEQDGVLYLVMEWVEGEQLGVIQEAARTSGGIPVDVLLRIAAEACAGLHAAHELRDGAGHLLDLVHRDINPTNVLLNAEGHVKVLDFGIAKSKGRLHVTRAGSIVKGKTPYLSPEQLGGLTLDRRSDLFSLGALFYLLATGLHPFRSDNELQTLENIALKAPDPPRSIAPDLPVELDKLIMRLLEKDPKKRFASAAEAQKELERIETQLSKSATSSDVARFVERVVGRSLSARRHELETAVATIEGRPPPAPLASDAAAALPTTSTVAAPIAVAAFDLAPQGAADEIPMATDEATVDESVPAHEEAAADVGGEAAHAPAAYEDAPVSAPNTTSPWVRLAILVSVGIAVGVLIIFVIESLRGPDAPPAPTSTAKATAAPTTPATQAEPPKTAEPTPPPPATETAAPVETAAPSASESAQPAETASAPPAPTPPPPPTGKPPTGKPPTGKPPTGKPPGKPPKKHNPTTI